MENSLVALGLSPREASLYLSLAESGKTTAHALSRRVNLPRASVYFLLESLAERGLVTGEKKRGTSFFSANPPSSLVKMLEREKDAVASKLSSAQGLIEQLLPFFRSRNYSVPRLQFFEGKDAVMRMLYDFEDEWHASILAADCTWWGFEDPSLFEQYESWYRHMWDKFEKVRKEKMKVRVFIDVPVASDLQKRFPNTILRPLPLHPQFTATVFLMGEFLLLLMSRQKPHYAFQIRDAVLAENLRVVFRLLWAGEQAPLDSTPAESQ